MGSNGGNGHGIPAWWRTLAMISISVMIAGLVPLIGIMAVAANNSSQHQQMENRIAILESRLAETQNQVSINTGRLSRLESEVDRIDRRFP